jgi:hypothetical protein
MNTVPFFELSGIEAPHIFWNISIIMLLKLNAAAADLIFKINFGNYSASPVWWLG